MPYLHLPARGQPVSRLPRGAAGTRSSSRCSASRSAALVRASAFGRLQGDGPDGLRRRRSALGHRGSSRRSRRGCARAACAFDPAMQVGAMVEVPSVAFLLDRLCRRARLLQHRHERPPAVLHRRGPGEPQGRSPLQSDARPRSSACSQKIVDEAHAAGAGWACAAKWAGSCGACRCSSASGLDETQHGGSRCAAAAKARLARSRPPRLPGARGPRARVLAPRAEVSELVERVRSPVPGAADRSRAGRLRRRGRHQGRGDQGGGRPALHHGADRPAARRRGGGVAARGGLLHRVRARLCHSSLQDRRGTRQLAGILRLKAPVEWGSLDDEPVRVLVSPGHPGVGPGDRPHEGARGAGAADDARGVPASGWARRRTAGPCADSSRSVSAAERPIIAW